MGSNYSEEVEFRCLNDCEQSGCPGHKMKLQLNRSTDTVTVWVDGEAQYSFDENTLAAICKLWDAGIGK